MHSKQSAPYKIWNMQLFETTAAQKKKSGIKQHSRNEFSLFYRTARALI